MIYILSPYPPDTAPSQRFRYEHYLPYLEDSLIEYKYVSFLSSNTWNLLYEQGHLWGKFQGIIKGYLRRIKLLFEINSAEFVLIHREATPLGPPVFEWLIAKLLRKKIIYDFDDAIWLPNTSDQNRWIAWLKWHGKVKWICKWAYKVSCGNEYLADYARKYNAKVEVLPTVVDTEHRHYPCPRLSSPAVKIGWTGSHSTLRYLQPLVPVLQQLERKYTIETVVIANQEPSFFLPNLRFIPWNKETEMEDLSQIEIGLMPLTDDQWAKGKCGFKAIQYQALSIPTIASPVGVNTEVVLDGKTGFLAANDQEWLNSLTCLIENKELREQMGERGRAHIQSSYSVQATLNQFYRLFS